MPLQNTEFTFTNQTFPVGDSGPYAMPRSHNTWTTLQLDVDRTPAGGLNALTTATVITVTLQSSTDNGKTWVTQDQAFFTGGQEQKPPRLGGGLQTADDQGFSIVGQTFPANTSWQMPVNVAGPSAVVVSGTVSWA